jgi:hypothetical protein
MLFLARLGSATVVYRLWVYSTARPTGLEWDRLFIIIILKMKTVLHDVNVFLRRRCVCLDYFKGIYEEEGRTYFNFRLHLMKQGQSGEGRGGGWCPDIR